MRKKFCLGIAGSLSHCSAVLAEEDGRFVCRYTNRGSGLHYREMADGVLKHALSDLVKNLSLKLDSQDEDADLILDNLKNVMVSISGLDERFDSVLLVGTLRKILFNFEGPIAVRSIGEAAYCGAFLDKPGILVRLGVGCSVFGRDRRGHKHLANAWGFLPGDLGGGYHIGQQVLHVLTRAHDGRATAEEKDFATKALLALREESVPQLFNFYRRDASLSGGHGAMSAIGRLSSTVFGLLQESHPIAKRIIDTASEEVSDGVRAVLDKLSFTKEVEVAFQGSLAEQDASYLESVLSRSQEKVSQKLKKVSPEWSRTIGVGLLALENPLPSKVLKRTRRCEKFLNTVDSTVDLDVSPTRTRGLWG